MPRFPHVANRPAFTPRLAIATFALAFLLLESHFSAAQSSSAPPPVPSAARIDELLARNSRARAVEQVAISPDGNRIAWSESSEIFVAPIGDLARSRRVSAASSNLHCTEGDLAWAPDSASFAFASDCAQPGEQSDWYLWRAASESVVRLTRLHGDLNSPAFSPDGHRLAFLYTPGATGPVGALAALAQQSGVIGEDGFQVQRIATVAIDAPQPQDPIFLTPENLHIYDFDWSPDSQALAFVAAQPPGENNWWIARLYTQSATPAAVPAPILDPSSIAGALHGLQMASPRWSPDGKTIAFIGGLMSDQGVTGGDLWSIPATGGQPQNLTPGSAATVSWFAWGGSRQIFIHQLRAGEDRLVQLPVSSGRPAEDALESTLFSFTGSADATASGHALSATSDRSAFVFQASSFDRAPEIYLAHADPHASSQHPGFDQLQQLSHFNDGLKPAWGPSLSLHWKNDGFDLQGWLIFPAQYDPAKKYPLIVEVHGGPAYAVPSRWNGDAGGYSAAVFSELGYFVLMPNPRGSFGQGEAFTQANRRDFGYGDLRDILAAVDSVQDHYPVDPQRIGIAGWSYGGFMAMFAVTQTHRFRAAVAGAGISNWLSYYGENSIDQWMIPYFGASVYDDPAVYAKSSAIDFIKNVQTPTLALVGDRDSECPAPQSYEFWHALRALRVPAQLVVYPNEGHGLADPAHRRDVLARSAQWFARFMPPSP